MKRTKLKLLVGLSVLLSIALSTLLYYSGQRVGKPIDSYHGVPVYDNGLLFFRSYGKNYSKDGY
jgi:hypothetical protein